LENPKVCPFKIENENDQFNFFDFSAENKRMPPKTKRLAKSQRQAPSKVVEAEDQDLSMYDEYDTEDEDIDFMEEHSQLILGMNREQVNNLALRNSTVPGAGVGLFVKGATIPKDTFIGFFRGESLTSQEKEEKYPDGTYGRYVLEVRTPRLMFLDAEELEQSNLCRFINHPRGSNRPSNVFSTGGGYLFTSRPVEADEELLWDYGSRVKSYVFPP